MNLDRNTSPAIEQLTGSENDIEIAAGQSLRIETSPGGAEILNEEVPAGKRWEVSVSVDIREFDA